jgi:iron complex outermembrane receptor protein
MYKKRIGYIAALAAVFSISPSFAQDATETQEGNEEMILEEVIVTGSYIKRETNATSSAPISQYGSDVIEGLAAIAVGDVLNTFPQVTVQSNGDGFNTIPFGAGTANIGVSSVSMRNLGTARTLVLLNGRRYVSGVSANTGFGVDLNSIPTAMIERIDVLTGGQSAVYGSDAVAGVINIITKKNLDEGLLNAMVSFSEDGGAERRNFDFSYGKDFDAGNAWVSVGYAEQETLASPDRDFSAYELRFLDTDDDGIRESIARRDGPAHVPGARLAAGTGANRVDLFGDGSVFNTNQPLLDNNFIPLSTTDFDNQHGRRRLVAPYERFYVASGTTFEISERSTFDVEINYSQVTAESNHEPIPLDVNGNVFRTGQGGIPTIDIATSPYFVGSSVGSQLIDALNASGITDTNLSNIGTALRPIELGDQFVDVSRDTFRVAGAYIIDFDNGMSLDSSAVYGITSSSISKTGDVNILAFRDAITIEADGNGGYQCADPTARSLGCVPVNPFRTNDSLAGQAGVVGFSPEALDYIAINTGQTGEISQFVVNSVLSGDLPWTVVDYRPMQFAGGIEYRKEDAIETPDPFTQSGTGRDVQILAIEGDFNVTSVFGEVFLPVADWLDISLALRYGNYSTVGGTTSYRLGFDVPINDKIRFRASQARSVRAPNVNDLFSNGVPSVADPSTDVCNGVDDTTTGDIAVNCRSIDAIANRIATEGSFTLESSEGNNTLVVSGGSQTLDEEVADSFTIGAVFTPTQNWLISLDYYDIKIKDAIATVSAPILIDRCYDVAPDGFDETCDGSVRRDPSRGPILQINATTFNADEIRTSGIDAEVNFVNDSWNVQLLANFLDKYEVVDGSGNLEVFDGRPRFPDIRLTVNASWDVTDHWNLFSQLRWRDETKAYLGDNDFSDDLNTLDSVFYLDLRANYRITDSLNAYVGINNTFDQEPDILVRGASGGTNTDPSVYDVIGRQYFIGANYRF